MTTAPMIAPKTVPTPPIRLEPPMTQAAIASSSADVAALTAAASSRDVRKMPAIAAIKPLMPNTMSVTFFMSIPERRLAILLPPIA